MESDFLGRAIRTTLPAASSGGDRPVVTTGYDADGLVSGSIDPAGNVSALTYNSQGWVATVLESFVDGSHPGTMYIYSNDGLLQSVTEPLSRTTTFSYDQAGRTLSVTAPDPDLGGPQQSSTVTYVYDALGNVLQTTDSLGDSSSVTYDARFRPVVSTDEGDFDTSYAYDVFGNLLSVTDARANTTTFTYDRWNRNYAQTKSGNERTALIDGLGRRIHGSLHHCC